MAPAPSATTWNSLAGNFVDPSIEVAPTGPVVGLFGFDVIAQFSRRLLQAQMVQSLNQHHVSLLSAFVPWGSIALPDSLLATMSMQFRLTLAVRLARFELRLVNPYIAAFHWPTPVADPIDGGEETTTAAMARVVGRQRTVDIGWQLELNVLTATPGGLNVSSPASPNSRTSSVRSPVTAVWPLEASMGASSPGGASDANWDRFTLATATAITSAVAQLSVPANLWRFGIDLDFSDAVAVVSSDDAAVTDFLATDTGRSQPSLGRAECGGRNRPDSGHRSCRRPVGSQCPAHGPAAIPCSGPSSRRRQRRPRRQSLRSTRYLDRRCRAFGPSVSAEFGFCLLRVDQGSQPRAQDMVEYRRDGSCDHVHGAGGLAG